MDPFSQMVGLATFHLKKHAADAKLQGDIEKLGFKIVSFDDTDMIVMIRHPSTSVMKKFLKVARESESTKAISQFCPSSCLTREIDQSTNLEAFSSLEGDKKVISSLHGIDKGNAMMSETDIQQEEWTSSRDDVPRSHTLIIAAGNDFQNTFIGSKQDPQLKHPISDDDVKDDNDRSKTEVMEEERTIYRRQKHVNQRYPEANYFKCTEQLETVKREQEGNTNDQKAWISYHALKPSSSDEESKDYRHGKCDSEQGKEIRYSIDLRSRRFSTDITQADSQPVRQDLLLYEHNSKQERSFLDQKHPESTTFTARQLLKDNDGNTARRGEKLHNIDKQMSNPSSRKEAKETNEEHHDKMEEKDQASARYFSPNTLRNDQRSFPDQKHPESSTFTTRQLLKDNDGNTARRGEKFYNIDKQTSNPSSRNEAKETNEEHHDKMEEKDQASARYFSPNTLRNDQSVVSKEFDFEKDSSEMRIEKRNEEDAATAGNCVVNENINVNENLSKLFHKPHGIGQNEEVTMAPQNPTGISSSLLSQNLPLDDVKNESYELMELSQPVFQNVSQAFRDSIGTYSYSTSDTGEKVIHVHVKKSQNFEDIMALVNRLESSAVFSDLASDATHNQKGNPDLRYRSGDRSDTHTSHDYFKKKFQGLTLEVTMVNITGLRHDVIVCLANKDLDMNTEISKYVSYHPGTELKDTCRSFTSGQERLAITDVLVTPAGNLPAKKVFHVVVPHWTSSTFAEDLMTAFLKCLVLADSRGFKSIAFPSISTMISVEEECFRIFIKSVIGFDSYCLHHRDEQYLRKITFFDINSSVVMHFIKFLKEDWRYLSASCNSRTYDEQNFGNEILDEIHTIYQKCVEKTSTGFDGVFSRNRRKERNYHPAQDEPGVSDDECRICCQYSVSTNDVLLCCNQKLCQWCKQKCTRCPFCQKIFQVILGNQPTGSMTIERRLGLHLAGYKNDDSYIITYSFPEGVQKTGHPNPGVKYIRTQRTAYLPAVKQTENLIKRLMLAFIRRLTFTVGTSLTTGRDNSIVWNGIHHKTNYTDARSSYGYPDPGYLNRLDAELRDRGVTLDTMTKKENTEISKCINSLHYRRIARLSS